MWLLFNLEDETKAQGKIISDKWKYVTNMPQTVRIIIISNHRTMRGSMRWLFRKDFMKKVKFGLSSSLIVMKEWGRPSSRTGACGPGEANCNIYLEHSEKEDLAESGVLGGNSWEMIWDM